MGRGDWCRPKPKPPAPVASQDYLRDLINHYQDERHISADNLGEKLGKTGAAVRAKKSRGTGSWTTSDLVAWCKALGIPGDKIGEAFAREMEAIR